MDPAEDMQIMCFGDVYVSSSTVEKATERSSLDTPRDLDRDLDTVPTLPAPIIPRPARIADSPSPISSQSSGPCQSNQHAQAAVSKWPSSLRSCFVPITFKGKLIQCLVSTAFLGTSLAACTTIRFFYSTVFPLICIANGFCYRPHNRLYEWDKTIRSYCLHSARSCIRHLLFTQRHQHVSLPHPKTTGTSPPNSKQMRK